MEAGQGSRRVLGDIGNLKVSRITEEKLISRPITRNLHAKLLANEQTEKNMVHVLQVQVQVQANDQGTVHEKKNVIDHLEHGAENLTDKPNVEPVDLVSSERKSRKKPRRNVKTMTSEIIAPSKEASGVLTEAEDLQVNMDADYPNELAVAEYVEDIYKFFKQAELNTKNRASDYMKSQREINQKMRSITVDWLIDTHWRFSLMPETLYLTVNIIDRYLSSTNVPKKELQLLGISSMLIACKYEEIHSPQVSDFITISNNAYTRNQILSMERSILQNLAWNLTVPTPYVFLVRFIRAQQLPDEMMENMVFFLAELCLLHYELTILYLPSMTAAAAVYAARCILSKRPFWNEILKHIAGYTKQQLSDCATILLKLESKVRSSNLKSVHQKFSTAERAGVSCLSPPEDIEKKL